MAFFEDLGKKIAQTSQGMVQKTKETADVIKYNGMISDEEKRIVGIYTQLGQKYFEIFKDSSAAELEQYVAAIKDSKEKIAQYAEMVKKLKGIAKCPVCGAEVPYGVAFCSSCGSKMDIPAPAPIADNTPRCANCGAELGEGVAFCVSCGTKVEAEALPIVEAADNVKRCPKCNAEIGEGVIFCTNCGTKMEEAPTAEPVVAEEPTVEEPVVEEQPEAQKRCPKCNAVVEEDAAFCTNCGTKVDAYIPQPVVSQPAEKRCAVCNAKVEDDAAFCTSCGTKL